MDRRMQGNSTGFNQRKTRNSNCALLLNTIRREGVCTRVYLAQQSSLKQSTMTYIIGDLIDTGLVTETGVIEGNRGRRPIGLKIDTERFAVLGIRIRRTGFSAGVFDLAGNALAERRIDYPDSVSADETMADICEQIRRFREAYASRSFLAVGVAVPGPFNMREGRIVLMTERPGWDRIVISDVLERHTGLPVHTVHDVNAGAWAQKWRRKELSESGTMVYVSLGQGVGSGALINGETMTGSEGFAGEIGHMSIVHRGLSCQCGNRGCLEAYTSTMALTREVNLGRKGKRPLSFGEIRELIRTGDPLCTKKFLDCCDYLATGLINVVNILDPDVIVIGDEMSGIDPEGMRQRLLDQMRGRLITDISDRLKLIVEESDYDVELCGAAVIAIREVFQNIEDVVSR